MAFKAQGLRPISKQAAARAFAACAGMDPSGLETPESAAHRGQCFGLRADTGNLAVSVYWEGGLYWCIAAAGRGHGMAAAGLDAMEQHARAKGCDSLGFQTVRRGLVRFAKARGYGVQNFGQHGYALVKKL